MSGSLELHWQWHRLAPGHRAIWQPAAAVALFATLLLGATGTAAQTGDDDVTAAFDASVAEYLQMRERVRASVMPEHIIDPHIRDIHGALLAARIRDARREALVGDVFTSEMSERIWDALHQAFDGTDVDQLLADRYPRGFPEADTAQLNASYTAAIAIRPPAAVLAVLPRLPTPELGYRLIGRDVVLWDEEAAIVVDIVSEALPAPRIWAFLEVSSMELRRRIAHALGDAHLDGGALVDEMIADTLEGATPPVVGEPFSWRLGNLMPPTLLHALPTLPAPLQYRFVAADLVVIDIQTNIVVGILHDALPAGGRVARRGSHTSLFLRARRHVVNYFAQPRNCAHDDGCHVRDCMRNHDLPTARDVRSLPS